MEKVRAKVVCQSVEFFGDPTNPTTPRNFTFAPVYDTSTPENERFSKYTPSGKIELRVDNPDVKHEVGAYYYMDFTKIEAEPTCG